MNAFMHPTGFPCQQSHCSDAVTARCNRTAHRPWHSFRALRGSAQLLPGQGDVMQLLARGLIAVTPDQDVSEAANTFAGLVEVLG
jgi:hypothetical protein